MSKPIVIWPEKVLNTPTKPVKEFGAALEPLLNDLYEAVRAAQGIGIAANQIGVPLRVALVGRRDGTFFEIVNPKIVERSGKVTYHEGCLSVPDAWEQVDRAERVRVRWQDRRGDQREEEAEGKLAHVFQHEIDHLDGTIYLMHLSPLKRTMIRERMERMKREIKEDPSRYPYPITRE
ncbi:MAG TPA: peptide deformylase [Myxococcaceae bacterium]